MNYYIHVPFCASKCGYCAFYSCCGASDQDVENYLEKLFSQLEACSLPAETVYIGGGTPTLLSCDQLQRLLEKVYSALAPLPEGEISIEANPETLSREKVALLKRYVSRISTGVQSFDPVKRQTLGRKCDDRQLHRAMEWVSEAGFPHWNCDLIYALAGETPQEWAKDLNALKAFPVDHVSCYNLTVEENARLGKVLQSDEDAAVELEEITRSELAENGIFQYEVSNYAVPGSECRHNLNVWRGGLLTAFGPSAAGFDGTDRTIYPDSLQAYLSGEPPEADQIPRSARLAEIFAVNLRTVSGWTQELWQQVPFADDWQNRLHAAEQTEKLYPGSFQISPGVIRLTPEGLRFWDTIAKELIL